MALTKSRFKYLEQKYGKYGSWAIWKSADLGDTQIISEHLDDLKTSVIMVGLNGTSLAKDWSSFHLRGSHDRKLRQAFNDSSYRGAYMTDIVKDEHEPNAARLMKRINDREIDKAKHIEFFRAEMSDLGVQGNALYIPWGQHVQELWGDNLHPGHLHRYYPNHADCPHYSNYTVSDAEMVDKVWLKLESHYRLTRDKFNTPVFVRNISMTETASPPLGRP